MRWEIALSGGEGNICHLNNLNWCFWELSTLQSYWVWKHCVICLVFVFMATGNMSIRLQEGNTTWASEVTLDGMQPWKVNAKLIVHLQDNGVYCCNFQHDLKKLWWLKGVPFPTPLVTLFFPSHSSKWLYEVMRIEPMCSVESAVGDAWHIC